MGKEAFQTKGTACENAWIQEKKKRRFREFQVVYCNWKMEFMFDGKEMLNESEKNRMWPSSPKFSMPHSGIWT